ncbi:integrase arm-type DNA-binding domain-containing protein [Thermaurantiacus sp.]
MTSERLELTDRKLRGLAPAKPGSRYEIADLRIPGLRVRVSDKARHDGRAGQVSFILYARFPPSTRPTRRTIGTYPAMSLADAREQARRWKDAIDRGLDLRSGTTPPPAGEEEAAEALACKTFGQVADQFVAMHVVKLRSHQEYRSYIARNARPVWEHLPIDSIRRRDVATLLDAVEQRSGPVAADKLLAILSKLFNWWATREDSFASPIVRGMARTSPRTRVRTRVLDDAEIRLVWKVASETPVFGAFLQLALLTGQRRTKISAMRWDQITRSGEWTIPAAPREKGTGRKLQLTPRAMEILRSQPRENGNPFVFPGRGKNGEPTSIAGYSDLKERFDRSVTARAGYALPNWTIHDLRRTARTLLSRCKVPRDISRMVLGHALSGVDGIYDQYSYWDDKADALQRLSEKIEAILADDWEADRSTGVVSQRMQDMGTVELSPA